MLADPAPPIRFLPADNARALAPLLTTPWVTHPDGRPYLGTRVVKFTSLANGEAPGAQDQNLPRWWKPRTRNEEPRGAEALGQPLFDCGGK